MSKPVFLEAAGVSDVGQDRDHNEDSLTSHTSFGLYAIADGMGGHLSGEVASQSTIDELLKQISNHRRSRGQSDQPDYYDTVVNAVTACNELVLKKNRDNGSKLGEGMGTTLVGAYFIENKAEAVIFNVGDSRLYRYRDDAFTQITRDHTMYQEWFEAGQKGTPPSKNILVKAIGLLEDVLPDVQLEKILPGDVYMICSDGLSNLVDDDTVHQFIKLNPDLSPEAICTELIKMANDNGGDDNISVIIIKANAKETAAKTKDANSSKTVQRKSI